MKAFLLAAGLGTRLRPLTDTKPKALVEVDGTPMLKTTVERLKTAGYHDIVINIHHFGQSIIDYLSENDNFGCHIAISDERDMLRDTGGAVRHAAPLLSDEPFLIHNVDIVSNLDLSWFHNVHIASGALATLLVSDRKTERYLLFDYNGLLRGWTNVATGEVKSPFPEDVLEKCHKRAFAGIHYHSPQILKLMEPWGEKFSIIDFYLKICAEAPVRGVEFEGLVVKDLGKYALLKQQ